MSKTTKRPELFQAINECNDESGKDRASFLRFVRFINIDSSRLSDSDFSAARGYRIPDYYLAAWLMSDGEMAGRVLPAKDYRAFWKIIETAKATLTTRIQRNPTTKKLVDLVNSLDVGKPVTEDLELERPQVAREPDEPRQAPF